jgi:arylsulfatase A-like enzyme
MSIMRAFKTFLARIFPIALLAGTPRCGIPAPFKRGTARRLHARRRRMATRCSAAERSGDGPAGHPTLPWAEPRMLGYEFLRLGTVVSIALAVAVSGLAAEKPSARKPNILFLSADQWRAQAFGFAGDPNAKTPAFDRLAKESFQFVNAISSVPVCCPTRATWMTGQRPLTHGVFLNDVPLDPKAVTMAKVLRAAGYDTGYIGKWHLDGHGRSSFIPRERRQGFEYWKVLECTHNYTNSYYYADGPEKLRWNGYDALAQTEDARAYLRAHAHSARPFLLFLSWGPPHNPYNTAPAKYRALFDPAKLILRPNVPERLQEKTRRELAGYYAHGAALDHALEALLGTLRETGLENNTILVFTSDHGDMLGSHGLDRKQKPYDESIRVPMFIRYPAGLGLEGKRLEAMFNTEDIMPTLMRVCGVPIPKTVQGRDFSGYLKGGPSPSDEVSLIACPAPFGEFARRRGGREYRGIRTPRYTYVRDLKGPWLLFDNTKDPYQMDNLAGRAEAAVLQARLENQLQKKLKAAHDAFLPAEAYVRQWGYRVDATGTVPYAP